MHSTTLRIAVSVLLAFFAFTSASQTCGSRVELFGNYECNRFFIDGNSDYTCSIPCRIRTNCFSGAAPLVRWSREINETTFIDLTQWRKHLISNYYGAYHCKPYYGPNGENMYNCDLNLVYCPFKEGFFEDGSIARIFECTVTDHSTANYVEIKQCANAILEHASPKSKPCHFPIPSQFSASYDNLTGVTLNWHTDLNTDNETANCTAVSMIVTVYYYATYQDFTRSERSDLNRFPRQSWHFTEKNTFVLDSSLVNVTDYYVFEVQVTFTDQERERRSRTRRSPLYFFGAQLSPSIVVPELSEERLSSVVGNSVQLRCEAQGSPSPEVYLQRAGLRIPSETQGDPTRATKTLVVTRDSAGEYLCIASGNLVPPEGGVQPVTIIKTIHVGVEEAEDETSELFCSPHGGTVCHNYFLGNAVLVNTTRDFLLQDAVEEAIGALDALSNVSVSERLYEQCVEFARALVCHSSYPLCTEPEMPRKVCKNSCDPFSVGGVCDGVVDWTGNENAFEMMMSNCDSRVNPAGSSPECVFLPFPFRDSQVVPPEASWCSQGNGQTYAGTKHFFTSSNRLCQAWVSQTPHQHPTFPEEELHHFAGRYCRNPGGRGERPWCYTSEADKRWEYCDVPQCSVCEAYEGGFCSHLTGYQQQSSIFVDRHESKWDQLGQARAENWMLTIYHSIVGSLVAELPPSCLEGIEEFMCHSTLPLCTSQDSATPSQLCNEHCYLLELLRVCPNDILRRVQDEMALSQFSFFEPTCGVASNNNNNNNNNNNTRCLSVQTQLFVGRSLSSDMPSGSDPDDSIENCYDPADDGISYRGTVSTTVSGATCQAWGDARLPNDANYCRNPGGFGERPWCLTDSENGLSEDCNVRICGESEITAPATTEAAPTTEPLAAMQKQHGLAVTLIPVFAIIGIAVIVFAVILLFVYFHFKRRQENGPPMPQKVNKPFDVPLVVNHTYSKMTPFSPKLSEAIAKIPTVKKSSIKYIRQLGQGNFGVVFQAKAEGLLDCEKESEVAVKTLKEEEDHFSEALEDFVHEAKLMFGFDHKNIVKILGVSLEEMPYYLIFEYMDKGDLAQFLRSNASSLQRRTMSPDGRLRSRTESTMSDEPPSLNVDQLTDICKQIVEGMKYLGDRNHVHRDLACRNCLVKSCDWEQTNSGLIVKIGDFGMSQNLYSADYYRVRGQAVLPIRWMSPEAVIYGKFSTLSDVWSFGVVMWEVFSFAMQPYYGTSNEEVTQAIRRNKILERPSDCPNRIYEVMKLCWNPDSRARPSFKELANNLAKCCSSLSSSEGGSIGSFDSDLCNDAFMADENSLCEDDAAMKMKALY